MIPDAAEKGYADIVSDAEKKIAAEIEELMSGDIGKGVSANFWDQAFWIDEDNNPWINGIIAIDESAGEDKQHLIDLLKSETPLDHDDRAHIAHMLWRYDLRIGKSKCKDKDSLINLLRWETALSDDERAHIAHTLERYDLRRPRARPRTPSYDRSDVEAKALILRERVKQLLSDDQNLTLAGKNGKEDGAVDIVAKEIVGSMEHIVERATSDELDPERRTEKRKDIRAHLVSSLAAHLLSLCTGKNRPLREREKHLQEWMRPLTKKTN